MFNTPFTCGDLLKVCKFCKYEKSASRCKRIDITCLNKLCSFGTKCINHKITKSFSLRGRLIIVELLCNIRMYLCIMPVA